MTPSQAAAIVNAGGGPRGIIRIDPPRQTGEQWHAHIGTGKGKNRGTPAVNLDGTWKHVPAGRQPPGLTKAQKDFLRKAGWNV